MSAYILAVSSGEEPMEFTKTAPVLDPKIPFFKYLDMLASISKDALSLRQQAYEIFLALNPHLSYASVSISEVASTQIAVKLNKKADILLKSSMILLQRYCLILQVSLPKLPSFRRRTHTSTLKAYEIRAVGYQDDLTQYQKGGALFFLQACFVRSQAAQKDMGKLAPSQRVTGALLLDGHIIVKGTSASPAAAESTEQVFEKDPSWGKDHATVQVAVAGRTTSTPAAASTRRTSCRKRRSAEAQVKVEVPFPTTDTPAAAPSESIPLTESALRTWEKDLEKLRKAGVMMEEQIAQYAHIRTNSKFTTPAAPPIATPTPARSNAAAVSYFPAIAPAALYASTASAEPAKRAKSKAINAPSVTLTAPTPPAVTLSTVVKPMATRAIFTPSPPTMTKSTTKRLSPATGTIRGSGVVRNLIRQYETPSSSFSTSSKGDRPEILAARKMKSIAIVASTTTTISATSTAEKKGTVTATAAAAMAKTSLKIGHAASTTNTTTNKTPKAIEMVASTPAPPLYPRKGASPDLGDKQNAPALVSLTTPKTITANDPFHNPRTPPTAPAPVRHNSNDRSLAIAPSIQTTKTKDGKRISRSHADDQVKASTLSASSSSRLDPRTTLPSTVLVVPSIQTTAAVPSTRTSDARFSSKASTGKQVTLDLPAQGYQTRPRPSLSASGLWNNPPPPLSQLRKISSSSVNTVTTSSSIGTVFRDGAESKPVVALGLHTFAPSNPPLEDTPSFVAAASEVNLSNFSNRPSPGSTTSKTMSSDESIRSWRRSVPTGVTADGPSHPLDPTNYTIHQSHQASPASYPIAEVGTVNWKNCKGDREDDDNKSHIDLVRIPTISSIRSIRSIRSSATASTTRTHSFSATSPLGSARFKPRKRPSLRNALVLEKKKEGKAAADVKEANKSAKKKTGYVQESDESDTETANLQYLELPPARGTQAWLDMRAQELEQENKRELLEDEKNANGSEGRYEDEAKASLLAKTRHDSKYSTMTIAGNEINSQRQTATSSRPPLSQVRFGTSTIQEENRQIQSTQKESNQELDGTTSSSLRRRVPSFTRPFKPEYRRAEYQPSFVSNSIGYRQNDSRTLRRYASTVSSSSTCTVRQPAPSHSVSPASSAFATLRATASVSSSMAPSVKSFATGSTVTLRTPKIFPHLPSTASTVSTSARSFFPTHGQTDDGGTSTHPPLSPSINRIREREVRVQGSLAQPVLASRPRQMNVQVAATTLIRNGSSSHASIYAQLQQQRQQEQQEEEFQQMYEQYRNY